MRAQTLGWPAHCSFRPVLVLVLLALATLLGLPVSARGADAETEQWYVIELMGKPAGRAVERTIEAGGNIITRYDMTLSLARMGADVELVMKTEFVETIDGKPVSMMSEQSMGAQPTIERFTFTEAGIDKLTTTADGRETKTALPPIEGEWMAPARASRFTQAALDAGDKLISVTTIDPTTGAKTITTTVEVLGPENVEVFGKIVPALKVIETQSLMPGIKTTSYINDKGEHLVSEIPLGAMKMRMLAADRDVANADFQSVEVMASTTVRPEGRIESPRTARQMSYTLGMSEGDLPALLHAGSQRVQVIDAGTARVTLDVDRPLVAGEEAIDPVYLAASTMLDINDEMIKELAARATADAGDDPMARALACREFVSQYIDDKNLGVGFANASDVARSRAGDCSEHGVLLCALLRASGIPARVVSGLVYVDQFAGQQEIFGYHMWAQAVLPVDGVRCWVDLDATLPNGVAFDASHIAVVASALEEGDTFVSMLAIAELMGRLKIRVEKTE